MNPNSYEMGLASESFNKVKRGTKTIELRLFDPKREKLQIGDFIIFSEAEDSSNQIKVKVIGLSRFNDFKTLINCLDLVLCGWGETPKDDVLKYLRTFYSTEKEHEYGVLGIHFEIV